MREFYYLLGPKQRRMARRLFYLPVDLFDSMLKRRPPLVPPKGMIFTGQGNFVAAGDILLNNLITCCNLQPENHVLDVGCGIGRIARPLVFFLNEKGRYEGFDVVENGIKWCKKHYSPFQNFSFKYIPLINDLYNLDNHQRAENFVFPYDDNSFDLVVLTSVFTHMQAGEVKNYMHQINRVLRPGGRCFATFFLITDKSENYLNKSPSPFFPYREKDFFLHNKRVKNANIAYRIEFIRDVSQEAGLKMSELHEGWWAGRSQTQGLNFQDMIVFKKK